MSVINVLESMQSSIKGIRSKASSAFLTGVLLIFDEQVE